jgi:hypothetical protein
MLAGVVEAVRQGIAEGCIEKRLPKGWRWYYYTPSPICCLFDSPTLRDILYFVMKNLQREVQKIIKEKNINLSEKEILLGIYEELSNLTRTSLAKEGVASSNPSKDTGESLGELGALILQFCSESGVEFERVVEDYLKEIS